MYGHKRNDNKMNTSLVFISKSSSKYLKDFLVFDSGLSSRRHKNEEREKRKNQKWEISISGRSALVLFVVVIVLCECVN